MTHRRSPCGRSANARPWCWPPRCILAQVGEFSFVLERAGRERRALAAGPRRGRRAGLHRHHRAADGGDAVAVLARHPHRAPAEDAPGCAQPADAGHRARGGRGPRRGPRRPRDRVPATAASARTLTAALQSCGRAARGHDAEPRRRGRGPGARPDGAARRRDAHPDADSRRGPSAPACVIVPDDTPEMAARIAGVARGLNAEIKVVVRARYAVDAAEIAAVGAWVVGRRPRRTRASSASCSRLRAAGRPDRRDVLVAARAGRAARASAEAFARAHRRRHRPARRAAARSRAPARTSATRAPVVPSARRLRGLPARRHAWVHLRICLTCGHVGCCDSSPHRHARAHFLDTGHPIIRSVEPGEDWGVLLRRRRHAASAEEVPAPTPAGER